MIKRLLILMVALAALTSCFKDTGYSTEYVLKPLVQLESGSVYTDLVGVKAFAFEADSVQWRPRSYEQALAGIVSTVAGDEMKPIAASLPYDESASRVSMLIEAQNVLIVVVDTENRCYAYTNYEVAENLATTYVSVIFRPWKNVEVYKDGTWFYYPTYIEPTPDPEPDAGATPDPTQQTEQ